MGCNRARLCLALNIIQGNRSLVTLDKEEYELLGLWGVDGIPALELIGGSADEEYIVLSKIVNDELNKSFKERNKQDIINLIPTSSNIEITIKTENECYKTRLLCGTAKLKFNSKNESENWLFICGKPEKMSLKLDPDKD